MAANGDVWWNAHGCLCLITCKRQHQKMHSLLLMLGQDSQLCPWPMQGALSGLCRCERLAANLRSVGMFMPPAGQMQVQQHSMPCDVLQAGQGPYPMHLALLASLLHSRHLSELQLGVGQVQGRSCGALLAAFATPGTTLCQVPASTSDKQSLRMVPMWT